MHGLFLQVAIQTCADSLFDHKSCIYGQTGRSWERQAVRDTIQEALSVSIAKQGNVGVASPPNKYPAFASAGKNTIMQSRIHLLDAAQNIQSAI